MLNSSNPLPGETHPHSELQKFYELCYYTLAHPGRSFIHQHVVDAYQAQHANPTTKPITLAFALIGLYLHLEVGCSGREVQREHMRLAMRGKTWPKFAIPENRGAITVTDVVSVPPGPERDQAIEEWCRSVWQAFCGNREQIEQVIKATLGFIPRRGER